jgi:hypothetical protein
MMKVGMRTFYPICVFKGLTATVYLSVQASNLTRVVLAAAALAVGGHGASASAAAIVETDRDCYLQQNETTVSVRGSGFVPGSPFDVLLDNEKLPGGAAAMGADGTMSGSFAPPALDEGVVQRRFTLGLVTAHASTSTNFTVTRLQASFWPNKGTATRLKVRFSLFGFGLGGKAKHVYVHYVAPNGRFIKTARLGKPRGQCGSIPKTSRKRLFPFKSVCAGTWRLQFDTRKRYTKGTRRSSFLYYTLKTQIRKSKAAASTESCRSRRVS